MNNNSLRTQIILPKRLREQIDKARQAHGESMAEYLRRAAEERLKRTRKHKKELAKLAARIVGSMDPKKSAWAGLDIIRWQRQMRQDRHVLD